MFSARKANSQDLQLLMKMDGECFVYGWDADAWRHAIKNFQIYIGTWNYKPIGYWVACKDEEDGNRFRAIRLGVRIDQRGKEFSLDLYEHLEQTAANLGFKSLYSVVPESLCRPSEFGYCAGWLNKVGLMATGELIKQFFRDHGTEYDGFVFTKFISPDKARPPVDPFEGFTDDFID